MSSPFQLGAAPAGAGPFPAMFSARSADSIITPVITDSYRLRQLRCDTALELDVPVGIDRDPETCDIDLGELPCRIILKTHIDVRHPFGGLASIDPCRIERPRRI